jgi:hypothetical protein
MIYSENTSENPDQLQDENDGIFNEYLTNIYGQCATVTPELEPVDYIKEFIINFLNLPNLDNLEDRSILIDDRLTNIDRDYLRLLSMNLNKFFEQCFGVEFIDGDIYLYYCLYQILVTNFADYFSNYLQGLQKMDSDYEEDIPNWKELSFEYFRKKIGDESPISIQVVNEYIDYICEQGIIADYFFELCLLESEGNVALSALYIESANNRIDYDSNFFSIKISKLLSFDVIKNRITNTFINIINAAGNIDSTVTLQ